MNRWACRWAVASLACAVVLSGCGAARIVSVRGQNPLGAPVRRGGELVYRAEGTKSALQRLALMPIDRCPASATGEQTLIASGTWSTAS